MSDWYVYMLRCADNTLYTGITTNVERRVGEHNNSDHLAARYTRARRPVVLVWKEPHANRSSASKREAALKRMSRSLKEQLLNL